MAFSLYFYNKNFAGSWHTISIKNYLAKSKIKLEWTIILLVTRVLKQNIYNLAIFDNFVLQNGLFENNYCIRMLIK